jgi:hypothetical protein
MGAAEDKALRAAAISGDVAACRAALDGGADKNYKNEARERVCEGSRRARNARGSRGMRARRCARGFARARA